MNNPKIGVLILILTLVACGNNGTAMEEEVAKPKSEITVVSDLDTVVIVEDSPSSCIASFDVDWPMAGVSSSGTCANGLSDSIIYENQIEDIENCDCEIVTVISYVDVNKNIVTESYVSNPNPIENSVCGIGGNASNGTRFDIEVSLICNGEIATNPVGNPAKESYTAFRSD
jgi:hypothetical protein